MKTKLKTNFLGIMAITAILLTGCGGGGDSSGDSNYYMGINYCFNCHSDIVTGKTTFGDSAAAKASGVGWMNGIHGNNESVDASYNKIDIDPDNTGFPYYGYSGLGTDPTCTLVCHDQLGDGKAIELIYNSTGIDSAGRVNRPVVGCESCHGPGNGHGGSAPVTYPKPIADMCGKCHNDGLPDGHLPYHPEGDRIYEDYASSRHSQSVNSHTYVSGSNSDVRARCSRCHTDEGAKKYINTVNGTATHDEIMAALDPEPPIADASRIECRTCHNGHNPDKLLGDLVTGLTAPADTWSSQFKTCTSCHQLLRTDETLLTDGYHDPSVNSYSSLEEVITDTHFATGGDFTGARTVNSLDITGYSMDFTDPRACIECHNPHNADKTINEQWANSGHADTTAAGPWAHYNWSADNTDDQDGSGSNEDRRACQRCHTATGFIFMTDAIINSVPYDPIGDPLQALTYDPLWKPEMLRCPACHTTNTGNLRDPGAFLEPNVTDYAYPAGRSIPDASDSNICVNCHAGRKTGTFITNYAAAINGLNFGTFNPHYLAAAGIMYRTIGYEYSGAYGNSAFFRHTQIGSSSAPGTGTNGPCIGCHMKTGESHSLHALHKDGSGQITQGTGSHQTCSACHTGMLPFSASEIEFKRLGYEEALDALDVGLTNANPNGMFYFASYPYFFTDATYATRFTNWANKDQLGAAFNLAMLRHEHGAFIHNALYTKRLILDSIDWIDNDNMDGMIDLSAYPYAAEWFQNDGTTANDNTVLRP